MIRESVHCFGPGEVLTGIVTQSKVRHSTSVVVLNSGLLHHVGPYRMFVDLSREIAAQGLPVLRFDLSGLGDSLTRDDALSERGRIVADIRAALDFMQKQFNCQRFVLVGLCSGADNAHWAALEEKRIVGAVMMDGVGYPNARFKLVHYLPRLFKWSTWRNKFLRLLPAATEQAAQAQALKPEVFVRPFPPREQAEQEIGSMVARGMKLLYLYTGGVDYFNHASQFKENFPSLSVNQPSSSIEVQFNREYGHTYSDLRHRRQMFDSVLSWLQRVS